jgi:hypothetical protein
VIAVIGTGWMVWRRRGRRQMPAASGIPAGMTPEALAFEAFTHGNTCLAAGQFAEATAAFERARELDPKRPGGKPLRARRPPAQPPKPGVGASRAPRAYGLRPCVGLMRARVMPRGANASRGGCWRTPHARGQALGDATGGSPWQEGNYGETIQTDLSETSEGTSTAAEAKRESRSTAPSQTAPGRCRLGDGRQTARSTTCASAGRSYQRADITAATTGVMVQGRHQMPHVRHGTPRLGYEPGEERR